MIQTQIQFWQDNPHKFNLHTVRTHLHWVQTALIKPAKPAYDGKQGRSAVESHWTVATIEINKCEASNINEISHILLHYSPSTYIEISSAFFM